MAILRYVITLAIVASSSARYETEPYPSVQLETFIDSVSNTTYSGSNLSTVEKPPEKLTPVYEQPQIAQGKSSCFIGNFIQGFGFDDYSIIPPDPSGAAGTERLVAVVTGGMIEVRRKDGVLTYRDVLKDFFSIVDGDLMTFDPKVIYDEHAKRFVVVTLLNDFTSRSRILIAVSKNERPDSISGWYKLSINSVTTIDGERSWPDYPGFEVDEEAVYITANMFTYSTADFKGVRLWIVDKGIKSGFYRGASPKFFGPYNPYQNGGAAVTTMPAQVHGKGGAGTSIGTYLVSSLLTAVQIVTVRNPLGKVKFSVKEINLGPIGADISGGASQRGSTTPIAAGDVRMLDAVWRSNKLWMTFTILPQGTDINANQPTAHWVRIDTTNSIFKLEAQGNLGGESFSPQTNTFFPAVALNKQGQVAFGYAASSPTMYAGAYGSVLIGTTEYPFTVQQGLDYYVREFGRGRNRWGDYSGISVDPTDDSFWIFNQFADERGSPDNSGQDGRWGTAWARVSCTVS